MIRISQLRAEVVRPACRLVGWHSPAAEDLLVGTFRAESLIGGDTCLRQLDGGRRSPSSRWSRRRTTTSGGTGSAIGRRASACAP